MSDEDVASIVAEDVATKIKRRTLEARISVLKELIRVCNLQARDVSTNHQPPAIPKPCDISDTGTPINDQTECPNCHWKS